MIDDDTDSVIISRYGSEEERGQVRLLIDRLSRKQGSPRTIMRDLQPYVVAVRRQQLARYRAAGFVSEELLPGVSEWLGDYDQVRGLVAGDLPAAELVV
jgi:hypothetical protein